MSTTDKDGGPAFPTRIRSELPSLMPYDGTQPPPLIAEGFVTGMSLRDFFAAMAMAGRADSQGTPPKMIVDAYAIADAMLRERLK